jgi:uncharacterized protein YdiU (UPF0061 family)
VDDQIDLESDLCVQIVLFCFPDDMARYSYKAQPEICKWNLIKLAEAMAEVLPLAKSRILLEDVYVYLTSIYMQEDYFRREKIKCTVGT